MRDREDWSEAYLKLLVIRRVGPSPKYDLRVEYVIRCHHVDFQPNWTTLGRPTSSSPKNPLHFCTTILELNSSNCFEHLYHDFLMNQYF